MTKGILRDRVLEDARNKAFRTANLPRSIREEYEVSIRSGSIILTARKSNGKSANSRDKK